MVGLKFSRRVQWWGNVMFPVRRVWTGIATRIGIRQSGLLKLRHDVRACEYEDIRVMWEMLNRNESEFVHSPVKSKKRHYWKFFKWARCAPYISRS
ncbi:hypothetical protein RIF29_18864 [Crotalaria pallida]|uniref:Uncharacterized protein n=1 Tax=Crotalaria pallida TaxID=3830 RepID=A0AAN9EYC9_CROPI